MKSLYNGCIWEKTQRMDSVDSFLSTTAFTPGHAPACSSPWLPLLLLVDMCMLPTGVHRAGWEGAFWLHCASWWLPPPPACLLACLLLVVTKFGRTGWRGDFCFWTTEFFICSDQISCEKEEANKWSSCMPCSHSACRGLEGIKALYTPTLWLCHVAFPEGSSPACLPVGMCWG